MFRVKTAKPIDVDQIRAIAESAGIDAWTATGYADEIRLDASIVLKAIDFAETIVGILVARAVPSPESGMEAELYNIAVRPDLQNRGCGGKLMDEFLRIAREKDAKSVWLEVRESNENAVGFYSKYGFRAELTRPDFYSNPTENAVVMRLLLRAKKEVT